MHRLEKIVKTFLTSHNKKEKSFLLALSGGADSMTLFDICLKENIPFEVAHVNHKWRKESDLEEITLKELCSKNRIKFHVKCLQPEKMTGNLEDACRKERLSFFKEIIEKFDLEGVILGHHLDDQAETVLKRIFEGASLSKLKGLTHHSHFQGIALFRPLLEVRKNEILAYAEEKKIFYFNDLTNLDSKFLRARLRKEIFPIMSKEFGKEIAPSLFRLGQSSDELHEFLEHFLSPFRLKVVKNGNTQYLDLSNEIIKTTFEWKTIVKDFLNRAEIVISHPTLEMVVYHLNKGLGKKELIVGDLSLKIFKKTLLLYRREFKNWEFDKARDSDLK